MFDGLLERCVYRKIAGSDLPDWAFTCFCKINSQSWDWLHLRCTQMLGYDWLSQPKHAPRARPSQKSVLTSDKLEGNSALLQYNCTSTVSAVRPKFAAALRSRPPPLCLAPLVQGQRRGSSPLGLSHGRRPVRSLGGAPPARAQPTDRPCETTNGEGGSHGRT